MTTIADDSDFRSGYFDQFPGINDSGTVAFVAVPYSGGEGIYTGSGGAISTVAFTGGPFLLLYTPVINTTGTVAFKGMMDDNTRGVYSIAGGTTTTIADSSGTFNTFGDFVSLNDTGTVAFLANLDNSGGSGIYTGSGGTMTTIAQTGGEFSGLTTSPSMNDSGTVAFLANLTAGGSGIFTGSGGATTMIADTSGSFSGLGAPIINNSGSVFFGALLHSGGLELYIDSNPIIGSGDALDGSTVTNLNYSLGNLNDNGSFVFYAELADGRSGLYVANVVPEPSSFVLLAGGGLLGLLGVAPGFAGRRRPESRGMKEADDSPAP